MGSATLLDQRKDPLSEAIKQRFGVNYFTQFRGTEMMADKCGFGRDELDQFALQSHIRAAAAVHAGAFENEIVPVKVTLEDGVEMMHDTDEGIRSDASVVALAGLNPITEGGVITAGNASQICDSSSATLVVSERALKEHGLEPVARIANLTVTAGDSR